MSKRSHNMTARQPLAATQAQVGDEGKDAEGSQRMADLKPQPPAAARSHANKPRPPKSSSAVSESYHSLRLSALPRLLVVGAQGLGVLQEDFTSTTQRQ
jgi:hypothetical protein